MEIAPEVYAPYVMHKGKSKILYCIVHKTIYGMLLSALLFYKQWKQDLESKAYIINPYDRCVVKKMMNGSQHTIVWHVDDVKASHKDLNVNEDFVKWVDEKYGDDEIGRVTANRGTRHDYLGMYLDYGTPGQVTVDMKYYVE